MKKNNTDLSKLPQIELTQLDSQNLAALADYCYTHYDTIENPVFAKKARQLAFQELPPALIDAISSFYYRDTLFEKGYEALLIKNLYTSTMASTPITWRSKTLRQIEETKRPAFLMMLIQSLFWHVVEYKEQRGGKKCHDIIPQKGDENIQIGTGSKTPLYLHTEDVPLENSVELIGLLTLRNIEKVQSWIAFVQDLELPESIRALLWKNKFVLPPDPGQLTQGNTYNKAKKSIFFGNKEYPSIRFAAIDIFENNLKLDKEIQEAVVNLDKEIQRKAISFVMEPGDFLLFSNRRCLHGRSGFNPAYTSKNKRWVLRMMALEGLQNSKSYRTKDNPWLVTERSIYPI